MHEIVVVQCPHDVGGSKCFMLVSEMHLSGMFRAPKMQVRWAIGGSTWANPTAWGKKKKKSLLVCFFVIQPQVSGSEFLTHTHTQWGDKIINFDYD